MLAYIKIWIKIDKKSKTKLFLNEKNKKKRVLERIIDTFPIFFEFIWFFITYWIKTGMLHGLSDLVYFFYINF